MRPLQHLFIQYNLANQSLVGYAYINFPNPFLAIYDRKILNLEADSDGYIIHIAEDAQLEVGTYWLDVVIFHENDNIGTDFRIRLDVINQVSGGGGSGEPENPYIQKSYGLIYFLEYDNVISERYRLEIEKAGYSGNATEIHGSADLSYSERKEPFQAIISSSLQINLEAHSNLTLEDLYSEDENTFRVKFYKGGQVIFVGFLNPDGIWEDFVGDRWLISMDATDGLSKLKNLGFLNEMGEPFHEKMFAIQIIDECLRRLGLSLPINHNCTVRYDNNATDYVLDSVLLNTERFYQNDGKDEVMDCEAVLKSILEAFNASIVQMSGQWWIFRTIDIRATTRFIPYPYNYGDVFTQVTETSIGSHINGATIFHCGANQKKSITASVQAYRVYYKYGLGNSLNKNPYFQMGAGLTSDGWRIEDRKGKNKRHSSGYGFVISGSGKFQDVDEKRWYETYPGISVKEGNQVKVSTEFEGKNRADNYFFNLTHLYVKIYIKIGNYTLVEGEGWVENTKKATKTIIINSGNYNWETDTPPMPVDGDIWLGVDVAAYNKDDKKPGSWYVRAIRTEITPSTLNIKGVSYTGQRTSRKSTVSKEDKTVFIGDSLSDLFVGTIYKADGQPTTYWHREGRDEQKELLEINAEDNLRVFPRPMKMFEGDVFGWLPIINRFKINSIPGKFYLSKYTFSTLDNVGKCVFQEYEDAYLDDAEFTIDKAHDNGETKVVIKS